VVNNVSLFNKITANFILPIVHSKSKDGTDAYEHITRRFPRVEAMTADSSLKCDGTRWRAGGEVKGKLANGVGSQYSSHYLGTWCIQH